MGHRLSKIYTKTGDEGETGLADGRRVAKNHPRVEAIGELADTFIRNSLMSANEIRSKIGLAPSSDPGADKLMNPNMPVDKTPYGSDQPAEQAAEDTEEVANEV